MSSDPFHESWLVAVCTEGLIFVAAACHMFPFLSLEHRSWSEHWTSLCINHSDESRSSDTTSAADARNVNSNHQPNRDG